MEIKKLLYFPEVFPELLMFRPVPGALFFDSGLQDTDKDRETYFRPENLPLSPAQARAYLDASLAFGENFKSPKEMAGLAAAGMNDFYKGSSFEIADELMQRTGRGKSADSAGNTPLRLQQYLILAEFLQKRTLELADLGDGLKQSWAKLERIIGLDEEDRIPEMDKVMEEEDTTPGFDATQDSRALPWKGVMQAMLAFLPKNYALLITDREIYAQLKDEGVEFFDGVQGLEQAGVTLDAEGKNPAAWMAAAPGWKLTGLNGENADKPWLDARRAVICLFSDRD